MTSSNELPNDPTGEADELPLPATEDLIVMNGHGGRRAGAGRPRGSTNSASGSFAQSRAAHEAVKAKRAELQYQISLGEYVRRDAIRSASATMLANIAQGLRSMQDQMERDLALAPEVAEAIGKYVDDRLDDLATTLQVLSEKPGTLN